MTCYGQNKRHCSIEHWEITKTNVKMRINTSVDGAGAGGSVDGADVGVDAASVLSAAHRSHSWHREQFVQEAVWAVPQFEEVALLAIVYLSPTIVD